jgi:multidrug efflux pump subunit AcrA (membrane-fusion protein)
MRRTLTRRVLPVGLGAALVAGGSVTAWAAGGSSSASNGWRTVTVGTHDVEQTLSLNGTVSSVDDASAAFPTSGTVTSVSVALGQAVTAGQEVARIDTADLQRAVAKATAEVTIAQDAYDASQSSSASSSGSASPSGAMTPGGGSVLQQTQQALSRDLDAARRATQAVASACGTSPSATATPSVTATPSASPSVTPLASPIPAPTPTASPTAGPDGGRDAAPTCATALADLTQAMTTVTSDENALDQAVRASDQSATSSSPSAASSDQSRSQTPTQGGSQGSQVAVLKAEAALTTAQANLAGAVLTSPIAGVVTALPYVVGEVESTSDSVTVVGTGAVRLTVEVPSTSLAAVRAGLAVRVSAAGATTPVDGTVEQVSLLPASSQTSSTTTYPVTILVPDPTPALASGATAAASIVLTTATDVVAVPNSALTSRGTGHSVRLLVDGKVTVTPVEVGAEGAAFTEVTSGVRAGDVIALAELGAALPASSGELTTNRFAGGAFPGGALPGGGALPPGGAVAPR